MSQKSRPVPTPEQRKFMEIRDSTEKAMLDKIYQAIEDAALGMAKEMQSVGLQLPSNNRDYFTLAAQQVPFVRLAVAIPTRFMAVILRSGNGSSGTASTPSITIGGKYPTQFHKSDDSVIDIGKSSCSVVGLGGLLTCCCLCSGVKGRPIERVSDCMAQYVCALTFEPGKAFQCD